MATPEVKAQPEAVQVQEDSLKRKPQEDGDVDDASVPKKARRVFDGFSLVKVKFKASKALKYLLTGAFINLFFIELLFSETFH